jgi:hypothetical protein
MSPAMIFDTHLVLGYVAWLLCFGAYIWPWLRRMDAADAQRAIATLHSFRFFGLVFILPGVIGPNVPSGFGPFAAYGDFATGLLAILALLTFRMRPLFRPLVAAFNVIGVIDILVDYYHGVTLGLGDLAGQLGATYAIPVIYVPLLMISHAAAFYLMLGARGRAGRAVRQGASSSDAASQH